MNLPPVLPQPSESAWKFVELLKQPRHAPINWARLTPLPGELDCRAGFVLNADFPDPEGLLQTAYADWRAFCAAAGISDNCGARLQTVHAVMDVFEAWRLEIGPFGVRILAADTEGIRRGLYALQDEVLRHGGPFLAHGVIERAPFIRTRVARCFFGPIKRPPKCRDELTDDVDYYPDAYLNRLASEGVNGLWLTCEFRDLARVSLAPEYGCDRERRLAKLRRTVQQCRRYGIKIYLFAIEPAAWEPASPVLLRHPELGAPRAVGNVPFCPFSDVSRQYLRECLESIFSAVPGLGGLINISLGERRTTCAALGTAAIAACSRNCPGKLPAGVLRESLSAMRAGLDVADPGAELIAWLYVPGNNTDSRSGDFSWIEEIAGAMPPGVILQYNFESNGGKEQLGEPRHAGDYWLSYVGPSDIFRACAARARASGARVSAKLQVACSHEAATVPFVPVPSSLFHKYRAMRELGVSSVMMCWYFGAHPGLMNKAAGELSFEPFPACEDAFLDRLAGIVWRERAAEAAAAYRDLWAGYEQYPVNCMMQYYGPMHDGPVWPLFLEPQDKPLAPSWLLKLPFSGDRIGECINRSHTFEEILTLTERMSAAWNRGRDRLQALLLSVPAEPARTREVGIVCALAIQFASAANIFRFYYLRQNLYSAASNESPAKCLSMLEEMKQVVRAEIRLDGELLELVAADSALGFHPEAEGFKYYPEKIQWRRQHLQTMLDHGFPVMEKALRERRPLFLEFTGQAPQGLTARAAAFNGPPPEGAPSAGAWESATFHEIGFLAACSHGLYLPAMIDTRRPARWKAGWDQEALFFGAVVPKTALDHAWCAAWPDDPPPAHAKIRETFEIVIEPKRLWPPEYFIIKPNGETVFWAASPKPTTVRWTTAAREGTDAWSLTFRLPFSFFGGMVSPGTPLRVNLRIRASAIEQDREILASWARPVQASVGRLAYGVFSPDELGWLLFET